MAEDGKIQGYEFTEGQAEAMRAMLSGRNVFLSGNAGTGKSYVLNAFIEELEKREVPYLAMAPTGIAAQNLRNGTTIHRTLQVGFGVLDPHDENRKTLTRKVLNKAEVVIIDEISMCRIDLFERVMNMVLAAKRVSGRKQVVLVGDFFQLPPVVTDDDRKVLMQLWPGNDDGYAFESSLWKGMGFEPHVLTEVVRQNDPDFIAQLNRARIGDRGCIEYFNERSVSDRKRAPEDDLWLCATNRMASTINDERVGELEREGATARTYTACSYGDVKPSDKPTDDRLRLVEGARVMLL
ncbi:MAG: AAA family ATPase, partial [Coriobacteriaceae bacterium]|nr:AAA family ATPase [Coriobacteriaceae bacterium]